MRSRGRILRCGEWNAQSLQQAATGSVLCAEFAAESFGGGVGERESEPEPFALAGAEHRTDNARTRSSGGTGLGLAIASRAIQRHRGSIVARNAEGGGLEVEIRLPLGKG